MSERIKKVNELLKQEINQLLLREVDFQGAMVTIIDVDTSSDLKYAKVKIVVYPEKKTEQVFQTLERNIYDIQQGLNKRLHRNMKYVPKIKFVLDKVEQNAQEIEKTLSEMKGLK